jgi:hypothetical protein
MHNIFILNTVGRDVLSRYSDSLRAVRSADRIPETARFSVPVQNAPGDHPVTCTVGIELFFRV